MTDIYKIGIGLSMASNHAQVLGAMAQQLLHVHAKVKDLQGGLDRLKLAIGGALATTAGVATLKVMQGMIDKGNELVRVQRNMAQAGASAVQVQESYAKAWEMTAKYKNIGATEIMKMINDARATFGDQNIATHEIESVTRSASFLRSYQGEEKGRNSHSALLSEMNAALKSGEIAGKITPEEMFRHIDQLTAMKVAFGSQLKVTDYLTAQRAAGAGSRNWEDDFRYGAFAAIVQENGSRGGTMLNTLNNKIVGGSGWTTAAARNAMNLGMLDPKAVEMDDIGRVKRIQPGGVAGWETFAVNPQKWVDQFLKPLLDKATTDPSKQGQLISSIFPNQNAARAITEMVQQGPKFHKDAALVVDAMRQLVGAGAGKYTAGSYDYQKQAFGEQVNNLVTAAGAALVPMATANLAKLNEALAGMAAWAGHKDSVQTLEMLAKGVGGLALALTVGGGVAIALALGPVGWVAAGLTVLAASVVALRDSGFAKTMADWANSVSAGWEDVKAKFYAGLTSFFTGIMDILKGLLPKAGNGPTDPSSSGLPVFGGSYTGGAGGASLHRASLGAVNDNLIPGSPGALRLKSGEAVGGGPAAAGLTGLAGDLQRGGAGAVTAMNDRFHHRLRYHSKHTDGLAVDLRGNPSQIAANTRALMGAAGLREGTDYRILSHPHGTGPHTHIQFQNQDAANAYARARGAPTPKVSAPPKNDQMVQVSVPVHIGGEKIAHVVGRQMASAARYPTAVGGMDTYGSWRPPGTTLTDAA